MPNSSCHPLNHKSVFLQILNHSSVSLLCTFLAQTYILWSKRICWSANVLVNMLLSHWPCFIWKFFMMWFHKILKLIVFLDIFLNRIKRLYAKVLLIALFIYFQGKIKFSYCIWSIWLIWIAHKYFLIPNRCFPVCQNLQKSCHFWKRKSFFLQILHQSSVLWKITHLWFFISNIIYFGRKRAQ